MSQDLSSFDTGVRAEVYRHFMDRAVAPSAAGLAAALGATEPAIRDALERLETAHHLALAPGTREVWMAHPFSAVPTPYSVETADHRYWANCAWDALAIPPLLGTDARVSTSCPDCGEPIVVPIQDGSVQGPAGAVVHFVVPPARFWENVGFT